MVAADLTGDERALLACFQHKSTVLQFKPTAHNHRSMCLVQLKIELNNVFNVTTVANRLVEKGLLHQPELRCQYSLTADGQKLLGLGEKVTSDVG